MSKKQNIKRKKCQRKNIKKEYVKKTKFEIKV